MTSNISAIWQDLAILFRGFVSVAGLGLTKNVKIVFQDYHMTLKID
jgi:hypothetical protein